ncbi:hypothetical protein ACIHFE_09125 [Streptomyces sp. NPDC052396]
MAAKAEAAQHTNTAQHSAGSVTTTVTALIRARQCQVPRQGIR